MIYRETDMQTHTHIPLHLFVVELHLARLEEVHRILVIERTHMISVRTITQVQVNIIINICNYNTFVASI